jgi:hypothetical protein
MCNFHPYSPYCVSNYIFIEFVKLISGFKFIGFRV